MEKQHPFIKSVSSTDHETKMISEIDMKAIRELCAREGIEVNEENLKAVAKKMFGMTATQVDDAADAFGAYIKAMKEL